MNEFRIRRHGDLFWVWQAEGKRYVRLETPYPSRADAVRWIQKSTPA